MSRLTSKKGLPEEESPPSVIMPQILKERLSRRIEMLSSGMKEYLHDAPRIPDSGKSRKHSLLCFRHNGNRTNIADAEIIAAISGSHDAECPHRPAAVRLPATKSRAAPKRNISLLILSLLYFCCKVTNV